MNRNIFFNPLHDSSDGPLHGGPLHGGRDARIDRLISQLDALGDAHAHEAAERGVADRVFNASARDLAVGTAAQPPRVLARLGFGSGGWQRWAGIVASAAVVGLAVMVPLGVFDTSKKLPPNVMLASGDAQLAPAGASELIVVGLFDGNAALESFDPSTAEGITPVAMTRGHHADQVQDEIQELLALGAGRRGGGR